MEKRYNPKESEKKWQKYWEEEKIYSFKDPIIGDGRGKPIFSIDTPPPTVSGFIHLGHVYSYVQAEVIARYFRQKGFNVFYPFGFDDNGLPTERFVERTHGVKAKDMPREKFQEMCLEATKRVEREFKEFWTSLGFSVDWSLNYSTIDDYCQRISQLSFIDLYEKGQVYRSMSPTLWCSECKTAIAQAEVEDAKLDTYFYKIVFLKENGEEVIIATTRPELLPSCVAVFFHPDDERYFTLIKKSLITPLFNRKVPVLTDEKADPSKGTGIVMCCTFGDITDIYWWEKHKLDLKLTIEKDGTLNENADKFKGLTIKKGREEIVKELRDRNLIRGEEKISHTVNVHERCQTEIEYLSTKQWFIKILDKKELLLRAGREIKWFPEFMRKRYENWVENLNWDWCISRQRFHGVPFPVWICENCDSVKIASKSQLPIDPKRVRIEDKCSACGGQFVPEEDVMDTWATSSVTPQINCRWNEDNEFFNILYPMDIRPQAHDIIRTWAFYTIVKGILNCNKIPWKTIMISGHGLSPDRKKISKSKISLGAFDPKDAIKKHCADSIRYWACKAKLGTDTEYNEEVVSAGERLLTKLWNASKFTITSLEDYFPQDSINDIQTNFHNLLTIDKWLISKMQELIKVTNEELSRYEFSIGLINAEKFFWSLFCDNYIEIIKDRIYKSEVFGKEAKISAQRTLYYVLLNILKIFAPYLPHITEEIYHHYFIKHENYKSIHISPFPQAKKELIDVRSEEIGDTLISAIEVIRKLRSLRGISHGAYIDKVTLICEDKKSIQMLQEEVLQDLMSVSRVKEINFEEQIPAGHNEQELIELGKFKLVEG